MTISFVPTPGLKSIRARVNLVLPGVGILKDITVVDAGKGLFVSNPSRTFTNAQGAIVRVDVIQLDASLKAQILAEWQAQPKAQADASIGAGAVA